MSHNFKKLAPVGKRARAEAAIIVLARMIPDLATPAAILQQSSDPEALMRKIRPHLLFEVQ